MAYEIRDIFRNRTSVRARLNALWALPLLVFLTVTIYISYDDYKKKVETSSRTADTVIQSAYKYAVINSVRTGDKEDLIKATSNIIEDTNISSVVIISGDQLLHKQTSTRSDDLIKKVYLVEQEVLLLNDEIDEFTDYSESEVIAEIAYEVDTSPIKMAVLSSLYSNLALFVAICIPMIWVSGVIYQTLFHPLRKSIRYIESYENREISSIPRSDYNDEISILRNRISEFVDHIERWKKEYQEQLRNATDRQEAIDKMSKDKDKFIHDMTHIMRTPLSATISAFGAMELYFTKTSMKVQEALREGTLEAKADVLDELAKTMTLVHTTLQAGNQGAREMDHTYRTIIDAVDVVYNDVKLRPKPTGILESLSALIDGYKIYTDNVNGISYESRVAASSEVTNDLFVLCDWVRFSQVINALVDNAFKFTEVGQVKVHTTLERLEQSIKVVVSVNDTGQGISPADVTRIYDVFHSTNDLTTTPDLELGAGLAVANKISQALNGKIYLQDSVLGQGSTFIFECSLPICDNLYSNHPKALNIVSGTKKILYVEDSKMQRFLFEVLSAESDLNVVTAVDGEEGYEKYINNQFDALLIDIDLPGQNGWELVQQIRKYEAVKGLQPSLIFSMTAHTGRRAAEKSYSVGFDFFMSKPFDSGTLTEISLRIDERRATLAENTA